MTEYYDLICLGGSSVDLILQAPRLPSPDEKLVVQYAGMQAGGLAANAACAAARLGMQVAWAGITGADDFGRVAMESLAQFGVDTGMAVVDSRFTTDFCVILLDPGGDRTILVVPTSPSPPPLGTAVFDALAHTRMVYTLPQHSGWFAPVADAVHSGGGLVAVDIEGSSPVKGAELQAALKRTDIVFCNRRGLGLAAGDPVSAASPASEAEMIQTSASRLLELGVQIVCVTLGKDGAWGFSAHQAVHEPGFSVPVVDTTGAGDCFHAAFLFKLDFRSLQNFGSLDRILLPETLRFANAAAALSVGHLGARGGLPEAGDVVAFLDGSKNFSGGRA